MTVAPPLASCLYEGRVRHRRFAPRAHEFSYSLFFCYLDLDELDRVFAGRWLWSARRPAVAWLRRGDHLGDPDVPMSTAVRDLVERESGKRPTGPIRLLTHLRYFGYCFNPVSFFYCFDDAGERVETIVAEVSNTPWRERHCYVLTEALNEGADTRKRYRFAKDFHVSPFMDMAHDYDWRFGEPGNQLAIHMENWKTGARYFDATMSLRRRAMTGWTLASALARFPQMTGKVIAAIYWQALLLWLKRIPFHSHPRSTEQKAQ